tara:strand:- start:491 stop:718 length:228 start_codon:yes stop_codon:yes gene_type:complete
VRKKLKIGIDQSSSLTVEDEMLGRELLIQFERPFNEGEATTLKTDRVAVPLVAHHGAECFPAAATVYRVGATRIA